MFVCEKNHSCCDYNYWDRWEDVEQDAKECGHLIEVSEVRHGQWIKPTKINGRNFSVPHCSACEGIPCGVDENTHYCPNCGAKMDLED